MQLDASKKIVRGQGSYLYDSDGIKYLDLCMGYGSVALGHTYEAVQKAISDQLHEFASPGFLQVDVFEQSKAAIESFVPGDYKLHGFYPSGALSIEICLKASILTNNKPNIVSFSNSMHGKTIATSSLGIDTEFQNNNPNYRLPNYAQMQESDILEKFENMVRDGSCAAVIVEPVLMSAGGARASSSFFRTLSEIAKRHGVFVIIDEILTGCYRMGTKFMYHHTGINPDFIVIGKALANGFPVAAVMHNPDIKIGREMYIGGTYYNHPLMSRAVHATIGELESLNINEKVASIELLIKEWADKINIYGSGAAWTIAFDSQALLEKVVSDLMSEKIIVSYYDRYMRLLPDYLIDKKELERTLSIINKCARKS